MLSGRNALRDIDKNVAATRRKLQEASANIDRARVQLMGVRNSEGGAYKRLASLRVKQLADQPFLQGLDKAERHVRDLLNSRETAVHDLNAQIAESETNQSRLESQRQEQADSLAQAAEALDAQQAKTQESLAGDETYQEQLWQVEKADSTAKHAEEKTLISEKDNEEKGAPYRDDRLFSYLWERGFGTHRYSAWPLTRFLDKWVARQIDYEEARVNYSMLTEIPKRLREHANHLQARVSEETEKLVELEKTAAVRDGIPKLVNQVEQSERALADLDASIEEEEARYAELLQEQSKFDRGEDPYFGRAIDVLVEEFRDESLRELRHRAENTNDPQDDRIVSELKDYDRVRDDLGDHISQQEESRRAQERRLHELESVRRRFKSHRYDAVNSEFSKGGFGDSLGGFIGGILTSDEFWRVVRQGQRFRRPRSKTIFGSGGFKRRRRSTNVWKNSGWGGRGGGSGGGGDFRTGGGF